jgi:hypothetical protein
MKTGVKPVTSKEFVVLQLAASLDSGEPACIIFPAGDAIPAIYVLKFGPASEAACEKWIEANCRARLPKQVRG